MRKLSTVLLVIALIAGCDSRSRDRAAATTIQSLAAERAMVSEMDRQGRLRRPYAEGMRRAAQQQIASNEKQRESH